MKPGLLVSVRSAAEAEAAVEGGADLIDVKEPSRGSLGRADDETIAAVIRAVAGRKPISAAMGEIKEGPAAFLEPGLTYWKWGLASQPACGWRLLCPAVPPQQTVVAAYVDWQKAAAPRPELVAQAAAVGSFGVLLLDTFAKDGSTLLDWLSIEQIETLTRQCHAAGVRIALAGSLGPKEIAALAHICPDWFAIRGAACRRGQRTETIDPERVRELVALVHAGPAVTSRS
jgi:uncharacterized protein (UPF0264 family)